MDNQAEKEPNRPAKPVEQRVELRASDADRERVVGWLRDAFAEGRLTMDEHAERVDAAYAARTQGELVPLTRDLPVHQEHVAQTEGASRPAARPEVERAYGPDAGDGPATKIVAIFGGAERKGRWRVRRHINAVAVFGGIDFDFTDAVFEAPETVIRCVAVFGGINVVVPEDVTLHGGGAGVFGGFDIRQEEAPEPSAPVVRIEGAAVFGGVAGRMKRRKRRKQELRRERRGELEE
ncbi:DUF1707 SHOCT-like domain-containing protein [Phaeacidiphilus oryzae]|uniref:DUF1707 SHOCT-like domain-containing protein n=1 Tax=Phaeacidiphilus oryzae TaxID=348818 RepID=UPI00056B401C|nr:DUF1707 domain-containing protein [Phaeacidiphilus oryzae]